MNEETPRPESVHRFRVEKYGYRNFAVYDDQDQLVVVAVYRKGAREVVRRLTETAPAIEKRSGMDIGQCDGVMSAWLERSGSSTSMQVPVITLSTGKETGTATIFRRACKTRKRISVATKGHRDVAVKAAGTSASS